jgi:hypothetical protein
LPLWSPSRAASQKEKVKREMREQLKESAERRKVTTPHW